MHDPKNIKVALLQGGTSSEREISLKSGKGAGDALAMAGYQVDYLDPADKVDLVRLMEEPYDVAFICLHGEGGEDGRIQGFLETVQMPYTCSGVTSSAICMDKVMTKKFYNAAGIPTPASMEITRPEAIDATSLSPLVAQIEELIGEPCVIKVPDGGSSVGVYIAHDDREIEDALAKGFCEADTLLIEQYIAGREVTVVALDRFVPEQATPSDALFETIALPIIEIIPINDTYDFDSKYMPGGSKHICPAELSAEQTEAIQALTVQAHKTLGCSGVSRTDFILDEDGTPWALETNTVPGMTQTSLLPDAARAAGISFPELCTQLIDNALIRFAAERQI